MRIHAKLSEANKYLLQIESMERLLLLLVYFETTIAYFPKNTWTWMSTLLGIEKAVSKLTANPGSAIFCTLSGRHQITSCVAGMTCNLKCQTCQLRSNWKKGEWPFCLCMKECKLCTSLGDAELVKVCYPMPDPPKIHNGTQEMQGSPSRFEYEAEEHVEKQPA